MTCPPNRNFPPTPPKLILLCYSTINSVYSCILEMTTPNNNPNPSVCCCILRMTTPHITLTQGATVSEQLTTPYLLTHVALTQGLKYNPRAWRGCQKSMGLLPGLPEAGVVGLELQSATTAAVLAGDAPASWGTRQAASPAQEDNLCSRRPPRLLPEAGGVRGIAVSYIAAGKSEGSEGLAFTSAIESCYHID